MDDIDTPPVARVDELLQRAAAGTLSVRQAAELLRELRRQLNPAVVPGADFDALMVWWLRGQWVHAARRRHARCKQCRLMGDTPALHQCARCHQIKAEAQCAHRAALGVVVGRGQRRSEGVHGFDDVDERNELIATLLLHLTEGPLVVVTHERVHAPTVSGRSS